MLRMFHPLLHSDSPKGEEMEWFYLFIVLSLGLLHYDRALVWDLCVLYYASIGNTLRHFTNRPVLYSSLLGGG